MLDLVQVGKLELDPFRFEGFPALFIQHRGHATGVVISVEFVHFNSFYLPIMSNPCWGPRHSLLLC